MVLHMVERMHQKKRFQAAEWAAAIFLLACWLGAIYLTYRTSAYIFDSDASSELILSKLLSEEGGILSRNWYYSTELRILNTQLLYSLLFRFTDSFRAVRVIANAIMQALLALSFLFSARQAGVPRANRLFCAGLLLLPVSVPYARIMLMHAYYMPHVIIGFLLIGLLFGAVNQQNARWKKRLFLTLYLLTSIVSGLGGIRQLMVTQAPLVAACLLATLRRQWGSRSPTVQERVSPCDKAPSGIAVGTEKRMLALATIGLIACFAGYLFSAQVLNKAYFGPNQFSWTMDLRLVKLWEVRALLEYLLQLFGYRAYVPVLTGVGIASLCGVMAFIAVSAMALILLVASPASPSRSATATLQVFGNLYLISLLEHIAAVILTQEFSVRMLIPATVMFVPLLSCILCVFQQRGAKPLRVLVGLVAISCVLNTAVTNRYLIGGHAGEEVSGSPSLHYAGITFDNIDIVRELRGAADFLVDNGYVYGFATFWNCNVLQEMTDGALRPISIHEDENGRVVYYEWLSVKSYREDILVAEKAFFLQRREDMPESSWTFFADMPVLYEDAHYRVYGIPSVATLAAEFQTS